MSKNKKAQLELGSAPAIVMIVGLVFLTMATMALIGQKYGNALDVDDTTATAAAEAVTQANLPTGDALAGKSFENAVCTIHNIRNGTAAGIVINSGNWTESSECTITNTTSTFVTANWLVNYTYVYSAQTVASNTTIDLETEIGNNTSIAGIILTISLIGIVLSILIGVFMGFAKRSNRV